MPTLVLWRLGYLSDIFEILFQIHLSWCVCFSPGCKLKFPTKTKQELNTKAKCCFHLLKYEKSLFHSVSYHCKLNILVFWTFGQTKQATWKHHSVLTDRAFVTISSHFNSNFYYIFCDHWSLIKRPNVSLSSASEHLCLSPCPPSVSAAALRARDKLAWELTSDWCHCPWCWMLYALCMCCTAAHWGRCVENINITPVQPAVLCRNAGTLHLFILIISSRICGLLSQESTPPSLLPLCWMYVPAACHRLRYLINTHYALVWCLLFHSSL